MSTTAPIKSERDASATTTNYTVHDSVGEEPGSVEVSITAISDVIGRTGDLSDSQWEAIQAIQKRDPMSGTIVTCRTHNPELVAPGSSLNRFTRGMAASTNCFNYTYSKLGPGVHEFQWVLFGVSDSDIRQFVTWSTYYLFIGWWANTNNVSIDQIKPDGTVITTCGEILTSPYDVNTISLDTEPASHAY